MAHLLSRIRRRLAEEDGLGIVEVMVSAMLLIIIGIAVLDGIDTATGISGNARAKAVAANVAQEDQERLRTMKAQQLSNFFEVNTATVSGITFTTTSRADWVSDADSSTSCESGSASNDYLKLTTTTKWAGADKSVKLESILAPPNGSFGPNQGSVGVQVNDRDDLGKPDVEVDVVGPPSYDKETDAQGCAFFGFLPAGNQYRAVIDQSGFVDPDGNQRVERAVSVQPEGLSAVNFKYDRAGTINADFDTKVAGDVRSAKHDSLMVTNSGLTAGHKLIPSGNGFTQEILASSLFPFPQSYTVYAGDCPDAQPPDPFRADHLVDLDPGEDVDIDVRMPALNLRVMDGSNPLGDTVVYMDHQGQGCGRTPKDTESDGQVDDPELPYGEYRVCVPVGGGHKTSSPIQNLDPNGTDPNLQLDISSLPIDPGSCPS